MAINISKRPRRTAAVLLATLPFAPLFLALNAQPVSAQSRPVVQQLPPPAAADLSQALRQLARSPADFAALVAAGKASLALGDIDAAVGFFGRADAVRAGDPQVKAGLASANLRTGRPIEALALFDQAIAAGAQHAAIAADRGLAYDLVGDGVSAQKQYQLALGLRRDDETVRRLALSQAISGDQRGFEATLFPLLEKRDLAAYRSRAFGLAILGREEDAVAIADAVMPREMASRMAPYLRYMPKLTRAQQAAASNLGSFPLPAQIGRDDPRFAAYSSAATGAPRGASDARLAPTGAPLGARTAVAANDTRTRRGRRQSQAAPPPPPPSAPPVVVARGDPAPVRGTSTISQRTATPPPAAPVRVRPVPTPTPIPAPRVVTPPPPPPVKITPTPAPAPVVVTLPPPPSPPPPPAAPSIMLPPVQAAPIVLTQVPPSTAEETAAPVVVARAPDTAPATVLPPPPEPTSLADAFAEFGQASTAKVPVAGAVDITAIKPKIERPAPPPPPPAPPPPPPKAKVPSRAWVQVATGRDPKALAFDWRKLTKDEPKLLGKRSAFTAPWGQTRRLVTGPFDSAKAATQFVSELKKAGIDAFVFTSDEGEEVAPLR